MYLLFYTDDVHTHFVVSLTVADTPIDLTAQNAFAEYILNAEPTLSFTDMLNGPF